METLIPPKKSLDEKGKDCIRIENENTNEIIIKFDIHETINANKLVAARSDGRKYFLASFTKLLNTKVEDRGIFCKLICKYNWFKNEMGRKTNSSYWRGVYICLDKNCKMIFTGTTESQYSNEMEIILKYSGLSNHEKSIFTSKTRCVGMQRENLAIRLTANGISNTRNEIIINNSNFINIFNIFFNFILII